MVIHAFHRFVKYTFVGITTFLFDLLLLWFFVEILTLDYLLSAGSAFIIAVTVNYILSRRYVFRGSLRSVGIGYVNFILIAGFGLLFVIVGMYILVKFFAFSYVGARIMVAAVTGFWNYLMNLYVNFKVAEKHIF